VGSCDWAEWALWDLGTIKAGESKVIVVPVNRFSPLAGEALESHLIVTDLSGAYTLGMRPTVIASDITNPQIVVSSDRSLSKAGETQNFTISVGNPTGSAMQNGLLIVEIPTGYSFVNASGTNEVKGGKIFWPIGNLAANQWLDETVTLQIDAGLVDGSVLFLEARLEDDSQLSLIARASMATTINSQSSMVLQTTTSYTSPVGEGDIVELTIDATNESGVQIAGVGIYSMTPSNTTASNSGITSGCVGSCDSAEWAYWDLGAINAANSEMRTFVQTLLSAGAAPENGSLLISNTYLTHISSPTLDQTLVNVVGVGTEFSVDVNHDSDSDGIPDWWEIRWGYDRLDVSDGSTDDDGDGADNLEEYQETTDPTDQDTDNDGIFDGPDDDPLNDNLPIADAGTDQTAREITLVQLDGSGSFDGDDPDQSVALIYAWTQTSGTNVALNDATAAMPDFTTPNTAPEDLIFQLTVEDATGNSAQDSIVVSISIDNAPVADAGTDQTKLVGDLVSLNGSNSSDDFDSQGELIFTWSEATATGVILSDPSAVNPTFTAPDFGASGGSVRMQLVVTDTAAQSSPADEVIINISPLLPPVADAGPDQNVNPGQTIQLDATNSSDADGNIVAYLWTQQTGTSVTLSDNTVVQPSFTSPAAPDSLTFMLTVTDNHGLMSDDEIVINIGSDPVPICDAGPDQNVDEFTASGAFSLVSLDGSNSTISGGSISGYLWTQISGNSVTLTQPNSVSTDFSVFEVAAAGASVTLELICTSDLGAQSSDQVIVNISDVNRAPQSDAGASQQVAEGESVSLDGSQSSDPDGDTISYLWSLVSSSQGTGITLDSTTIATPQFAAPDVDDVTGESFTFSLTVSDGSLSHSSEVIINVAGTDTPPTPDAGANQSVNEGVTVTLNGSNSSDLQGSISYQWSQMSGTQVAINNSTQAQATFTAPSVTSGSITLVFELTVTDSASNIATDQISITVNAVNSGGSDSSGGGGGTFILLGLLLMLTVFIRRK